MSTYPTYQAAKIANPESEIKTDNLGNFFASLVHPTCKPEDYCMTQEQFFDDGHNLEDGDIILSRRGEVVCMNHWTLAEFGVLNSSSHKTYILSAKALEETNAIPTETPEEKEALDEKTYRYEKVTDSIFDLKEEFERGELFSFDGNEHYVQIETEGDFSYAHIYENLYRRIEVIEVTERDEFIEAIGNLADRFRAWKGLEPVDDLDRDFYDYLFDSGDFKLVNGKG